MAAADRIDLNPASAQAANTETSAVAAEIAGGALPAANLHAAASLASAASMWVAAPAISTSTAEQASILDAALAARGVNIATRNVEAVSATIVTDEDNGRALTPHPEVST